MQELRCPNKLHGIFDEESHTIEVKCGSRWCGAKPGVVVVHRFNLDTLEMTTRKFKDPRQAPRSEHGARNESAAVRLA